MRSFYTDGLCRKLTIFVLIACSFSLRGAEHTSPVTAASTSPDNRFTVGECLVRDDFDKGMDAWKSELEKGGVVTTRDGSLEIDVPGGCSVWLKTQLNGPVLISYEATVVSAGGPNDRVSDLNCFWMAHDARSPDDLFGQSRSGKFSDYDQLRCYYVGLGGNSNKTTRFRRYIGEQKNRPILPEHDLSAKEFLLTPNVPQTVQLIAAGGVIGYYRDGRRVFAYDDPQPYTSGWFAFRTVTNHLRIKNFYVYRLIPRADTTSPTKPTKPSVN